MNLPMQKISKLPMQKISKLPMQKISKLPMQKISKLPMQKISKRSISVRMSSFIKKSGYDFSKVICALEGGSNMTEDVD